MPDQLCIGCNATAGILAEYLIETYNRNTSAGYHLAEYCAGTDRRQLIRITDKDKLCTVFQRIKQPPGKIHIEH